MGLLYCTADRIGEISGGGAVSAQECLALREFSDNQLTATHDYTFAEVVVLSRDNLGSLHPEPWKWDLRVAELLKNYSQPIRLAHFYSGTWPVTIPLLKERGTKVCITIAAHDKEVSRKEHEKLGWPFPYPHLIEEKLWQKYITGYRQADVIVCPSTVAEKTVSNYGADFSHKDIRVIPHGCHLSLEECKGCGGVGQWAIDAGDEYGDNLDSCSLCGGTGKSLPKSLPSAFTVGYLGSHGADKGVRYLLEAWKKLNYTDGSLLVLAGRDSTSPIARHLIERFGGGNIHLTGWQDNISDFYNSISLFVCPAATEGFNCEVLEAMAHGRAVICSQGAGAVDLVREAGVGSLAYACDVQHLADLIDGAKNSWDLEQLGLQARERAEDYTWFVIRQRYRNLWAEVLG